MTIITWPQDNQVIQQNSNGTIDALEFRWRGIEPDFIQIYRDGVLYATQTHGKFSDVPTGWYTAEAWTSEGVSDTIHFGVGDVFLVAGQSNSVSPLQPENHVMPVPERGQVILSDYYAPGKGFFEFRDPGEKPLVADWANDVYIGGCCWLYCGIAMDRDFPVMFVNVGHGGTSSAQWVTLIQWIFDAHAMYKPKAILWHQGETDSLLGYSQGQHFTNLNYIVGSLREVSVTPWFIAANSVKDTANPNGYAPVVNAQVQVVNSWPHVHQGPGTDSIRVLNEIEFEGLSLKDHGEYWASVLTQAGF